MNHHNFMIIIHPVRSVIYYHKFLFIQHFKFYFNLLLHHHHFILKNLNFQIEVLNYLWMIFSFKVMNH